MRRFDGCLLVSDVDGTLINSVSVSPYNVKRIAEFMEQGGRFTLATGRCSDACRDLIDLVGINAPAALLNGTVIYDYEKNSVVWSRGIEKDVINILLSVIGTTDGVGMEVHSRDKVIDLVLTPEVEKHNKYEKLSPIALSVDEVRSLEWNKALLTFECEEQRPVLREKLISLGVPAEQLVFTNAHLGDGVHNYLEVIPKGIDKGVGVSVIAKTLGIKPQNIFAIGDYYNDIPLLREAGCSAVVNGAPEDVTILADFVSSSVDEGAVGRFIDYIQERMLAK